jgi:putative hydrolase of the HAD superfamily
VESPRTVVFDLGGVLVPSSRVIPLLAAEVGVPEADFSAAYWTGRVAFDLGGGAAEYWTGVVRALGREPEPALLERLERIDAHKWSDLPPASAGLLAALDGERLAVLSNAPGPLAAAVRAAPWSAAMDALVFSAEVALMKPDPAIYARADELLGTRPGAAVFFDDKPENVEAARAHGWDAHVWEGPERAREVLGR